MINKTQKYNIGEFVSVKYELDEILIGRVESYVNGLYRIKTDKGFVEKCDNDIAYTSEEIKKRINFEKYCQEIKSYEADIMKFNKSNDFVLSKPTTEGHYLTIRIGYGGIYTNINYWKDGNWLVFAADGSNVIARSSQQIFIESYETVKDNRN